MAVRPVFVARNDARHPFAEIPISFPWFSGFSLAQKQRCIAALHSAARDALNSDFQLLEISSKSPDALGRALSAFNLSISLPDGTSCSVEAAYQGSKRTAAGGPYRDIYRLGPREARRDERVRGKALAGFTFFNVEWPLLPPSHFYDWLYISALFQPQNAALLAHVTRHGGFTDIEFNPAKQVSCQARSAAIAGGLVRTGLVPAELRAADSLRGTLAHCYGSGAIAA